MFRYRKKIPRKVNVMTQLQEYFIHHPKLFIQENTENNRIMMFAETFLILKWLFVASLFSEKNVSVILYIYEFSA